MSDALHANVRSALRTALLGVVKASLTSTDVKAVKLSPVQARLDRTAGSWVTDGFRAGDYLTTSGFGPAGLNGAWYVRQLSDLSLTVVLPASSNRALVNAAAGSAVTLTASTPPDGSMADGGIAFAPVIGQTWWRESYKAGPEERRSLLTLTNPGPVYRASVKLTWLYQLTVFYPHGSGTAGVESMADAIRGVLYPGRVLTYNLQATTILASSRQGDASQVPWVSIPISVRGFAYTFTP